jgi:flagellar basal-body rod modification protein FlgD
MDVNPVDGNKFFGFKPAEPKSELNMQTFMRLLTVQLTHQNPLEPMGDRDFFAQMAQMGTVQGLDQMKASLQVTQASSLLGKTVTAVRPMTESGGSTNTLATGVVQKLSSKQGEYYLTLQEDDGGLVDVKLSNIQQVAE